MNTCLTDIALEWLSLKVAPIPCHPGTKMPIITWKQYQSELPTESEVKRWFKKDCNLAIVTGGIRNLTILDFDDIPTYWVWRNKNPETAITFTVSTPRPGRHAYFFLQESCGTKIKLVDGVDIKGNRGIAIAPPSIIRRPYYVSMNFAIQEHQSLSSLLTGIEPRSRDEYTPLYVHDKQEIIDGETDKIGVIRSNIPILELAQRYTELCSTDTQNRWYMGLCPVHNDKNPSFRIDTLYNKCGCFSQHCTMHRGGDVIDLYAAIEKINLVDAIDALYKELI